MEVTSKQTLGSFLLEKESYVTWRFKMDDSIPKIWRDHLRRVDTLMVIHGCGQM